ncbi:hypothetical protein [Streptomyces xanthochromogenes]|uniref:hypothetical protein n=1 Tax=Streptomyces xanthochromogenes TaxID=67384 RepID=UPI002F41121A
MDQHRGPGRGQHRGRHRAHPAGAVHQDPQSRDRPAAPRLQGAQHTEGGGDMGLDGLPTAFSTYGVRQARRAMSWAVTPMSAPV